MYSHKRDELSNGRRQALAVVEDRLEYLTVWAGPVDRQLGDDLIYGGDHGARVFHAA